MIKELEKQMSLTSALTMLEAYHMIPKNSNMADIFGELLIQLSLAEDNLEMLHYTLQVNNSQ